MRARGCQGGISGSRDTGVRQVKGEEGPLCAWNGHCRISPGSVALLLSSGRVAWGGGEKRAVGAQQVDQSQPLGSVQTITTSHISFV